MFHEVVPISLRDGEPWEITAWILAVIAYPEDWKKRADFAASICVEKLLLTAEQDPIWADRPYAMKPYYLLMAQDRAACLKRIDDGTKILKDRRLIAAAMGYAALEKKLADETIKFEDGTAITQNNVARHLALFLVEEGRTENPDQQAIKDIWRESRSVLHLCMSLAVHAGWARRQFPEGNRSGGFEVFRLLDDSDTPRTLVELAGRYMMHVRLIGPPFVKQPIRENEQIAVLIKDPALG